MAGKKKHVTKANKNRNKGKKKQANRNIKQIGKPQNHKKRTNNSSKKKTNNKKTITKTPIKKSSSKSPITKTSTKKQNVSNKKNNQLKIEPIITDDAKELIKDIFPNTKKTVDKPSKKVKRKLKVSRIILFLILFISLGVVIFSLLKIFLWNKDNEEVKKIKDDVSDVATERPAENATNVNPPEDVTDDYWYYINMDMMSVDFNELKAKNPDTVGFIKVNGTNINYPVVQTTDNDYYLTHAFDKSENDAGWIYADYRNNMVNFDKNTIIYGHGRLNNTMFGSLKNITESSWYNNKDNYIIKFSTPTENTLWQVFSVYTIPVESYYLQTTFSSDSEYDTFLQTLKSRSVKDFSAKVNSNDKIITLSTCKDVAGTQRVVMHAKLIKSETR